MTKRAILSIVIVHFFTACGFAQDQELEIEEGTSFGVFSALPVGSFKATDINGGFAKPGWGVVFDSRSRPKFLGKKLGLYFHSTYQWNETDQEKMADFFTQALGNRTVVSEGKYSPILTTIGPSYILPFGKGMALAFNTGVGVMFNNTRAISISVYDASNTEILRETVNFDNDPAFAYVLGLELKFNLIKGVMGGAIYADYTASDQATTLSFQSSTPVRSEIELRYLNVGFKLTFPKKATP